MILMINDKTMNVVRVGKEGVTWWSRCMSANCKKLMGTTDRFEDITENVHFCFLDCM